MRWFNKKPFPLFATLLTGVLIWGLILINLLPHLRLSILSEWLVSFLPFVILYSLPVMFLLWLLQLRWQWWVPLGLLLLWNAAICLPYIFYPTAEPLAGHGLKIYVANVYQGNKTHERLIEQLKAVEPDVIFLQEVDATWVADVEEALATTYPYRKAHPAQNNFGLMLLSKLPLQTFNYEELTNRQGRVPIYAFQIDNKNKSYHFLGLHTLPPTRPSSLLLRNQQLEELANRTQANSIVMGDFNTSVYSPYFKHLLNEGNLQNPRSEVGMLHSWPAEFPFLGASLDHILVGKSIDFGKLQRMPSIGSDHLPLQLEIE